MDAGALSLLLAPDGWALLGALPPYDEERTLALSTRLHAEGFDPALVAAALTQSRLRAKARAPSRFFSSPSVIRRMTGFSGRASARSARATSRPMATPDPSSAAPGPFGVESECTTSSTALPEVRPSMRAMRLPLWSRPWPAPPTS